MARIFTAAVLIFTLVGYATYEGARQDVGTGVGKLGDWIKSDPKK